MFGKLIFHSAVSAVNRLQLQVKGKRIVLQIHFALQLFKWPVSHHCSLPINPVSTDWTFSLYMQCDPVHQCLQTETELSVNAMCLRTYTILSIVRAHYITGEQVWNAPKHNQKEEWEGWATPSLSIHVGSTPGSVQGLLRWHAHAMLNESRDPVGSLKSPLSSHPVCKSCV